MGLIRKILLLVGIIVHININRYREIKAIKVIKEQVKMSMIISIRFCHLLLKWKKNIKGTHQEIYKISILKPYQNTR